MDSFRFTFVQCTADVATSRLYSLPPLVGGFGEGSVGVFGVCCLLHATRRSKRGGNCRKYGDYDVEDLAPNGVVVEGSHSLVRGPTDPLCLSGIPPSMGGRAGAMFLCKKRGYSGILLKG